MTLPISVWERRESAEGDAPGTAACNCCHCGGSGPETDTTTLYRSTTNTVGLLAGQEETTPWQ